MNKQIFSFIGLLCVGCANQHIYEDTYAQYKSTLTTQVPIKVNQNSGRIYQEDNNMFSKQVIAVGDIIKVNVLESTIAKVGNNINNERNNNISMKIPLINIPIFTKVNSKLTGVGIQTQSSSKLEGKEQTDLSHNMSTTISVALIQEYTTKNGKIFEIQGTKNIVINQVPTYFKLMGFIQEKDIVIENKGISISSDKINELTVIQSNGESIHLPLINTGINKYSPM